MCQTIFIVTEGHLQIVETAKLDVGRFAYKSFRIQVDSHTSRSFRRHDLGRFAYIEVVSPIRIHRNAKYIEKVLINTLTR